VSPKVELLMLESHPLSGGALPKVVPELSEGLRQVGFGVRVLYWGRRRTAESWGTKLRQRARDVVAAFLTVVHSNIQVVVVHTYPDRRGLARDLPLIAGMRLLGRSVCAQFHGSEADRLVRSGSAPYKMAVRLSLLFYDTVFVLSETERAALELFRPNGRFVVTRYILEPAPPPDPEASSRYEWYPNGKAPVVLFAGRLIESKGILDVLAAVEEIASRQDVRLLIAGSGPLQETVRTRLSYGPLRQAARFLGYITGPELRAAYECADVFILPTTHGEGFPHAVLDALRYGVPIVCTATRGLADFLRDGENGFFVEPNRSDAIVDALETLFSSPDARIAIRRSNLELVREFTREAALPAYVDAINAAAARRRNRPS
jgi:glycosyltransferase involved in cell wall biosynthesis